MEKKTKPQSSSALFPEGTVFVRSTTNSEREEYCQGDFHQLYYTVIDEDGDKLVIVCGPHNYAFAAAEERGEFPVWMH